MFIFTKSFLFTKFPNSFIFQFISPKLIFLQIISLEFISLQLVSFQFISHQFIFYVFFALFSSISFLLFNRLFHSRNRSSPNTFSIHSAQSGSPFSTISENRKWQIDECQQRSQPPELRIRLSYPFECCRWYNLNPYSIIQGSIILSEDVTCSRFPSAAFYVQLTALIYTFSATALSVDRRMVFYIRCDAYNGLSNERWATSLPLAMPPTFILFIGLSAIPAASRPSSLSVLLRGRIDFKTIFGAALHLFSAVGCV